MSWFKNKMLWVILGVLALYAFYLGILVYSPVSDSNPTRVIYGVDCFSYEMCYYLYDSGYKQDGDFVKGKNLLIEIGERYGTFGDSFGALTSLFTALSFLGVAYTLFLQKKEFQRMESTRRIDEIVSMLREFEKTKECLLASSALTKYIDAGGNNVNPLVAVTADLIDYLKKVDLSPSQGFSDKIHGAFYAVGNNKGLDFFSEKYADYLRVLCGLIDQGFDSGDLSFRAFFVSFLAGISERDLQFMFFLGMRSENRDLKLFFEKFGFFRFLSIGSLNPVSGRFLILYDESAYDGNERILKSIERYRQLNK